MPASPFPDRSRVPDSPLALEAVRGELRELDAQLHALLERRKRVADRFGALREAFSARYGHQNSPA